MRENNLGERALKAIGKRVRKLREGAGMTQRELGAVLRTSAANVRHIENGKQAPSAGVLVCLCKHMKVSADTILGLKGKK